MKNILKINKKEKTNETMFYSSFDTLSKRFLQDPLIIIYYDRQTRKRANHCPYKSRGRSGYRVHRTHSRSPLCSKATETLGKRPERIKALLSANILKNAMGVGIPGTGMIGLPIAIALGALIGKSEYQLEVLKDSTPTP